MAGDTAMVPDRSAADDDLLKRVRRTVEEAQRAITQQKGRVARLRDAGANTSLAMETLAVLEANLKRLETHKDWLELGYRERRAIEME